MTTEQFFHAVSSAVRSSLLEIAILLAILAAIAGYALNALVLRPRRYMRAKTEALVSYLRERHNLTAEEWGCLTRAARRAGVVPPYLAAVSEASFETCREPLRHEMNDDGKVDELAFKLFN